MRAGKDTYPVRAAVGRQCVWAEERGQGRWRASFGRAKGGERARGLLHPCPELIPLYEGNGWLSIGHGVSTLLFLQLCNTTEISVQRGERHRWPPMAYDAASSACAPPARCTLCGESDLHNLWRTAAAICTMRAWRGQCWPQNSPKGRAKILHSCQLVSFGHNGGLALPESCQKWTDRQSLRHSTDDCRQESMLLYRLQFTLVQ